VKKILIVSTVIATIAWSSFIPTFGGVSEKGRVDKNFVHEHNNTIVSDLKNKKSYSDIKHNKQYTQEQALAYCEKLELANTKDWRLPTKEELKTLFDFTRKPVNIKYPFANTQESRYWSSTTANHGKAYYADFDLGRYSRAKVEKQYFVLCVRDKK